MKNKIKINVFDFRFARKLFFLMKNHIEDFKWLCFYKELIGENPALVYDVGANFGRRTRILSNIGYNVVSVEPQSVCINKLKKMFRKNKNIEICEFALGSNEGIQNFYESKNSVLSTLSKDFISSTSSSGRFNLNNWSQKKPVKVRTLQNLIEEKGLPKFIKIDVEGYEYEVLNSLKTPIEILSIEFAPEMKCVIEKSIDHIRSLGDYHFNISWFESAKMSHSNWIEYNNLEKILNSLECDNQIFGDIYMKLRK